MRNLNFEGYSHVVISHLQDTLSSVNCVKRWRRNISLQPISCHFSASILTCDSVGDNLYSAAVVEYVLLLLPSDGVASLSIM